MDHKEPSTIGAVNSLDLIEAGNTFVYFIGKVAIERDKNDDVAIRRCLIDDQEIMTISFKFMRRMLNK